MGVFRQHLPFSCPAVPYPSPLFLPWKEMLLCVSFLQREYPAVKINKFPHISHFELIVIPVYFIHSIE